MRVYRAPPPAARGISSSAAIAYVLGAIVDRGREMRGRGATERRRESRCQRNARLIAADAVPWPLPTRSPRPTRRAPTWVFATIRSPATMRESPGPAREARSPGRSAPRPSPRPRLLASNRAGSTPRPSPRWGCPAKPKSSWAAPAARAARRASWRGLTAMYSFFNCMR